MPNETLPDLLRAAASLERSDADWLLHAAQVSDAIGRSVMGNPDYLSAVRSAVQHEATAARCDYIVGASPVADLVVRPLNDGQAEPSRALLFDLVRVTGAAISQALPELRHVEVVPAVLVDLCEDADTATCSLIPMIPG